MFTKGCRKLNRRLVPKRLGYIDDNLQFCNLVNAAAVSLLFLSAAEALMYQTEVIRCVGD